MPRTEARTFLIRCRLALLAGSLLTTTGAAAQHSGHHNPDQAPVVLAPGYAELNFVAPPPGTYELPPLGYAGDGEVLTSSGERINLASLLGDKPVLLSFIYTSCNDVNGCPLASYVLGQVAKRIVADDELKDRVRLLSLSFDPAHDTPPVMAEYATNFKPDGADWQFLTSAGESELGPILTAYDQSITQEYDDKGAATGRFSHILRVYLIDQRRRFRNIYSVSFLHADTIINDIKTILAEAPAASAIRASNVAPNLHRAGDVKEGYETHDYETRSAYLPHRRGTAQDLIALTEPPPLGLPALPVPPDNPLTTAKVELGRKLFFDRRLSLNQTLSCAMCHVPEQGFANNELATAVGLEGRSVRRNSPTIYNVGYMEKLFHDARDDRLEHQIWQPLLLHNEMANPSVSAVVNKVRGLDDYRGLFEQAFEGRAAGMETISQAIASYERTLVSANSPFDRWYFGGDKTALDDSAARGFAIFSGKGHCSACHLIGETSALFTDHQVHNTGIGYARSMRTPPTTPQRVLLAPGVFIDVDPDAVTESSEKPLPDLGYYEITQDPADRWKYRTPSLRNVALTEPYMHDGSLPTLEAVVDFYVKGGIPNELRDPLIAPLELTEAERTDLVAFLRALTGDDIDRILSDSFDAPVGNAAGRGDQTAVPAK